MTVYKVTSTTGYKGHKEGEQFEADLTEAEERRAKERGSIRVIRRDDKHEKEDDTDA
jgi:hypothetical protein